MNVLKSWGEGANHKTWLTELKVVASGELDDCCEKEELRSYRVFANVLEIIIFYFIFLNGGFPSGSVVKNLPAMQDIQEVPWHLFQILASALCSLTALTRSDGPGLPSLVIALIFLSKSEG